MRIADLSPQTVEKLKTYRYDCIIEKHEGPEKWSAALRFYDPEFIEINGYNVLLPVSKDRHANITVIRCIVSDDGQTLTLFLKDTTHVIDPKYEMFEAGFLAICDKFPDEDFFIAIVYHEWFIIEKQS
jgi:hypothetical protein